MDVGKQRHKKYVGINFVLPRQGHLGKMCQHLAVAATCRRHVSNFLSQALHALKLNKSLARVPLSTFDATKGVTRILDAKYAKADFQSIVKNNCTHLSANHQKKLLQLLAKFELHFDGTLGDWKN